MRRAAVVVAAMLVSLGPVAGACTSGDEAGPTTTGAPQVGIDEGEAIEIARSAVAEDDPAFDPDQNRPIPHDLADTWDVSFVPLEVTGNGGEAHVVIDRETGDVLDLYRTK